MLRHASESWFKVPLWPNLEFGRILIKGTLPLWVPSLLCLKTPLHLTIFNKDEFWNLILVMHVFHNQSSLHYTHTHTHRESHQTKQHRRKNYTFTRTLEPVHWPGDFYSIRGGSELHFNFVAFVKQLIKPQRSASISSRTHRPMLMWGLLESKNTAPQTMDWLPGLLSQKPHFPIMLPGISVFHHNGCPHNINLSSRYTLFFQERIFIMAIEKLPYSEMSS